MRAEQVSAAVDRLLQEPEAQPELLDPEDEGLMATAQQLAQLPVLLGPAEPALEQRILRRAQTLGVPSRQLPRARLGWVALGVAVLLFVVFLLSPMGQTTVASFLAVFDLGLTEVRIESSGTPSELPATVATGATALQTSLTLAEAQEQVSYAIPQPAYLPNRYELLRVTSYVYPDLPAWVPQPVFLELIYGDGTGEELILRVYAIMLGEDANISRLNLQARSIRDVQDIDVNDRPGVLLQLDTDRTGVSWKEVVWEQDDLIMALSSANLTEDELLRIARSVHQTPKTTGE